MKKWELVNFCEFDENAVKSYCAIHNEDANKNLGDITKVDETKLDEFNFICGGSPCQDFSIAGDKRGSVWTCDECGLEYNPLSQHYSKRDYCPNCGSMNINKSRSSLLVEWLRIIRHNLPNFGIYENVKNIVGKQFIDTTFKLFIDELNEYGYNTYWKVLNASDYCIPQSRERLYLFIVKKELDSGKFSFPNPKKLTKSIKNYINFEEKNRQVNQTLLPFFDNEYKKEYKSNNGCIKYFDGEVQGFFNSDFTNKRIYSYEGVCPALTTNGNVNIWELKGYLTSLEKFRLMGFSDEQYYKAKNTGIPDGYLKKQAGNSIIVDTMYYILLEIYKAMPYLFDDLKVSSYFSGIGAFEVALNRLYDEVINKIN